MGAIRTVKVAAIQPRTRDGEPAYNLARAEALVVEAVERGAELVVCPELLATGYCYSESLWERGEPAGGPTEQWLARLARGHRIHLGAGYLEVEGDDFYNTFSLFGPDGERRGRVRKGSLPFCEGWYFVPCTGPKLIDTRLGLLGVGICHDNQTAPFLREALAAQPDLVIMPHSAPTAEPPLVKEGFRRHFEALLGGVAARYAEALGVPVVMANKVSDERTSTPLPPLPGARLWWRFRGLSTICEAGGATLARLEDAEGALVAEVTLDPARKRAAASPRGYWAFPPPLAPNVTGAWLRLLAALGQWSYRRNGRRVRAARACGASAGTRTAEPVAPPHTRVPGCEP